MILVDSSVWIDYFRGASTTQADKLDTLLTSERLAVGDLVVAEVLRGFRDDLAFEQARELDERIKIAVAVQTSACDRCCSAPRLFWSERRAA